MTSPTSEELLELRDRAWALIYPEIVEPGTLKIYKRGPFQVRYNTTTKMVELLYKVRNNIYVNMITFRRPSFYDNWEKDCKYCTTCAECLPELRALMVLDDLADI